MRKFAFLLAVCALCPAISAVAEVHTLVVLSPQDHTVYDVDPASGKVLKQVQLPGAPRDAVFSWDELHLFVSVPDAAQVAIIDAKTFQQTGKLESPEFKQPAPLGLANSADGNKMYVSVAGGLLVFDPKLLVFSPDFKQAGTKIAFATKDGGHFGVHGPSEKLYFPDRGANQVTVVDTKTNAVLKTVPVPGGPMDVVFLPGNEAWVDSQDGNISVIDTSKDAVKQTIQTGGKGAGRITVAADIRYVAATHADSGDVTLLQPMTKEIVSTVKTGAGTSMAAFAPNSDGKDYHADPTKTMYVTNASDSDVEVVDLSNMSVTNKQKVGSGLMAALIHYTYSPGFAPPREGTDKRLLESDTFTMYTYSMFLYDISPVHQHRGDMVGVWIGTGTAKNGCWVADCPSDNTHGQGGVGRGPLALPYNNGDRIAGSIQHQRRGVLHQEEGGSNSPPESLIFELKNNYYRQSQPRESALAKFGFRKIDDTPKDTCWDTTIWPGDKPLVLPDGDYAQIYLGGGLIQDVRNGTPQIDHRFYGDWDYMPYAHTITALTNPVHIVFVEFK